MLDLIFKVRKYTWLDMNKDIVAVVVELSATVLRSMYTLHVYWNVKTRSSTERGEKRERICEWDEIRRHACARLKPSMTVDNKTSVGIRLSQAVSCIKSRDNTGAAFTLSPPLYLIRKLDAGNVKIIRNYQWIIHPTINASDRSGEPRKAPSICRGKLQIWGLLSASVAVYWHCSILYADRSQDYTISTLNSAAKGGPQILTPDSSICSWICPRFPVPCWLANFCSFDMFYMYPQA